ncbi:MAG: hypothetical protein IPN58_15790 [Anaerolineales bacterium]|nr:hypothetical protein [Anaerolineales bacterium]
MSIPYAYFFLLVTKESSYLTFYVSGMVFVLFVILIVCGGQILQHFAANPRVTQRLFAWVITPVLIVVSFNSNRYLYTMWVRPNDISYTYVKNVLKNSDKSSRRIHIIGSTGEVDVYWINATRMALLEMGEDAGQYKISYADSEYMINLLEQSRFDYFSQSLSSEDLEFMRSQYLLNTSFGYYYLSANAISADDLQHLETIFEKLDVIPNRR